MSHYAPFTLYVKVVPQRGMTTATNYTNKGGRLDYIYDLQALAKVIYDELSLVPTINIGATGQKYSSSDFGTIGPAVSAKPQFGNNPATVSVEGFYFVDADPIPVYPDKMLFHANRAVTGQNGPWQHDHNGQPVASVVDEVIALKSLIDTALTLVIDDTGASVTVFRLVYKGIVWGDKGRTFPRP